MKHSRSNVKIYAFNELKTPSLPTNVYHQISNYYKVILKQPICLYFIGVFYQAASVSSTLRITSLPSGRYIVSAAVIAGCSPFDQNQAITVTFCNRTSRYPLAPYYGRWMTRTVFIRCDLESEVRFVNNYRSKYGLLQTS